MLLISLSAIIALFVLLTFVLAGVLVVVDVMLRSDPAIDTGARGRRADLVVKEHVAGVWSYHLARRTDYTSLCGKPVMNTAIPREHWGNKAANQELRYRWCDECRELSEYEDSTNERSTSARDT